MGIFEKIFKKRKKDEIEKQDEEQLENDNLEKNITENNPIVTYDYRIDGTNKKVHIFDIKKINRVKHSDGRNCDVFMLRTKSSNQDGKRKNDSAAYICFEVKENTRINKKILDFIAHYYHNLIIEKKANNIKTDRYYLGEIEEDKENYKLGEKSLFVNEEFDKFIDKRKHMERIHKNQEGFREDLIVKDKNEKEQEVKKEERVQNFYLKQIAQGIDNKGKKYQEYEGINISIGGNRGYILEIKALQKHGKDGSGTYLYSGYIGNTLDKKGVEYFDYWNMRDYNLMTPVCFELYRRLDDIVKDGDRTEIEAVLNFLSAPQNFKGSGKMNYIGHLNKITNINQYGEIERKIVEEREEKSSSPTIERQIKKLQGDYVLNNSVFLGGGR